MWLCVHVARLGKILDRHPEALEPMKTAMKYATVPDVDEPVMQPCSFIKAPTASALLRMLAANGLHDTYLEMLVLASDVPEAIHFFEGCLKTKDPARKLVSYVPR